MTLPNRFPLSGVLTESELHRPLVEYGHRGFIPPTCPECSVVMQVRASPFVTVNGPDWECPVHAWGGMIFENYPTNLITLVRARWEATR